MLLALALRDRRGRPYRLADFVDSSRVFVSERTAGGAKLRALEHPGLWNGSMAGWNTVFVEIPKEAFTPVKTVLDLLRPEHQSGRSTRRIAGDVVLPSGRLASPRREEYSR